jgi:hypothetical protein
VENVWPIGRENTKANGIFSLFFCLQKKNKVGKVRKPYKFACTVFSFTMSFSPVEGIVKAIHFVKGNVLNVINPAVNGSPDQKDTKKNRKRRKRRRTCALFVVPKCSGRMSFIHLPPHVRLSQA